MSAVEKFCDRAIVLKDGRLVYDGDPHEAAVEYQEMNFSDQTAANEKDSKVRVDFGTSQQFNADGTIKMHIDWDKDLQGVKNVGVAIFSIDGAYVYGTNTINDNYKVNSSQHSIDYDLDLNLGKGIYTIKVGLFGDTDSDTIYFFDSAGTFQIVDRGEAQGIARLTHRWG